MMMGGGSQCAVGVTDGCLVGSVDACRFLRD